MKTFTAYSLLALSAIASALVVPDASHGQLAERDAQSVDLVFLAGPASYNLTIPANGQEYATSRSPQAFLFPCTMQASEIEMHGGICLKDEMQEASLIWTG